MSDFSELVANSDKGKDSPVALYLFSMCIDGRLYGGEIPAENWETAVEMVSIIGGKIVGRSLGSICHDTICSICGEPVKIDLSHPEPMKEDDWQEDFE